MHRERNQVLHNHSARVTAIGEETALSGIMRLVAEAQASGSRAQALADRAAAALFYVARRGRCSRSSSGLCSGASGGPRTDRHRARHRLPACVGAGHPPGHRHQHLPRGAEWAAREGSARPGARQPRSGDLRQDRHAHARPAGALRGRLRRASRTAGARTGGRSSPTGSIHLRGPSLPALKASRCPHPPRDFEDLAGGARRDRRRDVVHVGGHGSSRSSG